MSVVVVGWDRGLALPQGGHVAHRDAQELQAAVCSGALVVVLGPRALAEVAPDVAALVLDGFGGVVLAADVPGDDARRRRWRSLNLARFVAEADLAQDADRLVAQRPHRRLSLYEWLGPDAAGLPERLLAALRDLPRLDLLVSDEWAASLGLSPRSLLRLVRSEFPSGPGGLLRDYRLRSARALCRSGYSMAEVAPSVGYSHASSLCRALGGFWPTDLGRGPKRFLPIHRDVERAASGVRRLAAVAGVL